MGSPQPAAAAPGEAWFDRKRQRDRPEAGLAFRDLNCHGFTSSALYQPTFISHTLAIPKLLLARLSRQHARRIQILDDIEGFIGAGEMLLVLGRPGSGCSTFLKSLAGDTYGFHIDEQRKINYGGIPYEQMHRQRKGERIYLAELDIHFPELTVGETLEFAASTRSRSGKEGRSEADPREVGRTVASLFGLSGAYSTQIGDAMIRGVSGGEKRRTSLAEAFIGDTQFQFWDNSIRGLDSSTALRVIKLLRKSTDAHRLTVAMSIYQASEAMYESFDKVMVLYEGRQIYFGPVSSATEYFTGLGFVKPDRATSADFLTSLTNPAERVVRPGCEATAPRTPDEFAVVWKHSPEAKALRDAIDGFNEAHPFQESPPAAEQQPGVPKAYAISVPQQIGICISRSFLRLRNNYVPAVSAVFAGAIIAIVIGTVYFGLDETTDSMDKRAVLLFLALLQTAMTPAFDLPAMWSQRPIVEKHDRYAFYYPVTEMFASFLCSLPQKFVESLLFHIPLYFMTNLRRTPSAFFTYWLFMFSTVLVMSALFRMVGSLSKRIEQTLAPVSTTILCCVVYTGFVIPPAYMVPWLGWFRWINPISYTYESLLINEFRDRAFACTTIIPSGPGYAQTGMDGKVCSATGAVVGQPDVQGSDYLAAKFGYQTSHMWRNLPIILAMMIFFGAIHLLAAQFIKVQRSRGEILLFVKKNRLGRVQGASGKDEETGTSSTFAHDMGGSLDPSKEGIAKELRACEKPSGIFHWSNLKYEIKTKEGPRRILNDINGWVKPGTLTAMMGVTGAGKTSLLDVLANRISVGSVEGQVYIDNKLRDATFGRRIGYVQQEDIHQPTTTVREALEFSALLRQPSQDIGYVDTVLDMLDMNAYADAVVGVPGEGLNVEQRRRLTIAVEMVAKPELLLFLDEPTSGLDSQTAWSICMLLRKLADNGQAILCTLHQPSSQLIQIFDRLLLLGSGGEQLYFGPIGPSGSTLISYFESSGAGRCPAGGNPAEWIIELTGPEAAPTESDEEATAASLKNWARKWEESEQKKEVVEHLAYLRDAHSGTKQAAAPAQQGGEYAAHPSRQFWLVLKRNFRAYWRDPISLYSKLSLCLGISLANGLSFTNSPLDIQGLTDLIFSMFLILMLFAMLDQQIIPRLVAERDLFEAREFRNKSYSWVVFVAANLVVELFWQTVAAVLFFVTWYFPTGMWRNGSDGFHSSERAGLTFVIIWLFCLLITTLSHAVTVGIPLADTAVQMASLLYWFSLMFCGVLVFPALLPRFWVFVNRATPFTYLLRGLLSAGLADTRIVCSPGEQLQIDLPGSHAGETCLEYLQSFADTADGYVVNPDAASGSCLYCPMNDTNDFFASVGIDVHSRWSNVGFLAVYVVFNIGVTFAFYWLARVPRQGKQQ